MQSGDMIEAINAFLLVFAGLFPIVNPLGSAPIFLSLTSDCTAQERDRLARGVAFNGFWLLLGSMLFGSAILEFFGITVPVVRVAGGLLVTAMGWKLLNEGSNPPEREAVHREGQSQHLHDSFYPLTVPLTVGPGSISVAITLGANAAGRKGIDVLAIVAALVGSMILALIIYLCYGFADRLARILGPTATTVFTRLSAFLLLCIGVQIMWNGISQLLSSLPASVR